MNHPLLWPEPAPTFTPLAEQAEPAVDRQALARIERLDKALLACFKSRLVVSPALTRPLVSFQANKDKAGHRWFKFKEAFSAPLIEYLLHQCGVAEGKVLDPFAGSGTALFVAAAAAGLDADGIEVLPIGQTLIAARRRLEAGLSAEDVQALRRWAETRVWESVEPRDGLPELRITAGAYPPETKVGIEKYLTAMRRERESVRELLLFALLCVLESVSYTRKDGQYLRWDHRCGRALTGKAFDKGAIIEFGQAVGAKIREIIADLAERAHPTELFQQRSGKGEINLHPGSCLEVMPALPAGRYDALITSPPYCNRYDYTRTYALELALLGIGEKELAELRQRMLSCTVENREKDLLQLNPKWEQALAAAEQQDLLQAILRYLDEAKALGRLNNNGIPRMVRGYFYEMACVIAESARVLKPGAPLLMVNDNVRYAGASISVDLILSAIAEQLGFTVENILVLPNGKGNSSQQMGEHGREALRKSVYVWRKRQ